MRDEEIDYHNQRVNSIQHPAGRQCLPVHSSYFIPHPFPLMPTFKTVTLGCKVNQYETEYLREGLVRLGYEEAGDDRTADLCVVNTCTVTAEGDLKSRKVIRQLARQNPRAEIVVMGCYATRAPEEVAVLPGVVEVLTDKRRLPDLLSRMGLIDLPAGISSFGQRHRAYVKVQDGCRMECSYCIIPAVRPVLRSRPADEVLAEVARLAAAGHREIVLTGIHLGHYGVDLAGDPPAPAETRDRAVDLACLIERVLRLEGEFRVRLSSLEAAEVTPRLIGLMADQPGRLCPHLHLSLQSGSDAVLRRMRRRYNGRQFAEKCCQIRESLDTPSLTTDAIVGFPGESETDFEATCRLVEEAGFSKVHVFRFSPRHGTPAASLPDQVPGLDKQRRAAVLNELARRIRRRYLERLVGRRLQVLVESTVADQPGLLLGTSARYAPVEFRGRVRQIGRLVDLTAERVAGERIRGAVPGI
jgi:threonylcarbamoyladenosine tRNA methylthiotransferase MtaB